MPSTDVSLTARMLSGGHCPPYKVVPSGQYCFRRGPGSAGSSSAGEDACPTFDFKPGGSLRQQYPEIPWKEMAGMRDRLICFYFGVDYQLVWTAIKHRLPSLMEVFRKIQEDLPIKAIQPGTKGGRLIEIIIF